MTGRDIDIKVRRGKSLDDILIELSASGMSRKEISERIGGVLTPERVDQKVTEILEAPDWLTEAQQERALLRLVQINLMDLRNDLENFRNRDTINEDGSIPARDAYNDNMKLQLMYIDRIFDRYNRRAKATDEDLNTWSANTGRELGAIVDETLAFMKGALRAEIDGKAFDALKIEAMQHAWTRIQARQVERAT